jgi:hypothetical protein
MDLQLTAQKRNNENSFRNGFPVLGVILVGGLVIIFITLIFTSVANFRIAANNLNAGIQAVPGNVAMDKLNAINTASSDYLPVFGEAQSINKTSMPWLMVFVFVGLVIVFAAALILSVLCKQRL